MKTTGGGDMRIGDTVEGEIELWVAHNWAFNGSAGQEVTITVQGWDGADPQARLIAPNGEVIASDDDSGENRAALMVVTLPETGTYYIRIDVYSEGRYRVILE